MVIQLSHSVAYQAQAEREWFDVKKRYFVGQLWKLLGSPVLGDHNTGILVLYTILV